MSHEVARPVIKYRCVNSNLKAVDEFYDYLFNKVSEQHYKLDD